MQIKDKFMEKTITERLFNRSHRILGSKKSLIHSVYKASFIFNCVLFFISIYYLPYQGRQDGTDKWPYDKYP